MSSLSDKSDNELVDLAVFGDQTAFACLFGRYSSLIHAKAVAKSSLCGCDIVDDLSQEAAIGFFNAVKSYDPAKGAGFRTYVETCVENVLVSAVRSYVSRKNRPLNNHKELNDSEISGSVVSYGLSEKVGDPQNYVFADDDFDQLMRVISSSLTALEKAVLDMRIRGYSYEETADKLGIGVKSVDNAIQRVRQKMKSLPLD